MLRGGGGARARHLTWAFLGCRLRHPRPSAHPGREHHRGHAPGSSRTAQPDPPTRHRPIPLLQLHLHRLSGGPPGLSSTRLMPTSPQTLAPVRQKLCLSFCLQSPPPSPVAGLWMQLRCSETVEPKRVAGYLSAVPHLRYTCGTALPLKPCR